MTFICVEKQLLFPMASKKPPNLFEFLIRELIKRTLRLSLFFIENVRYLHVFLYVRYRSTHFRSYTPKTYVKCQVGGSSRRRFRSSVRLKWHIAQYQWHTVRLRWFFRLINRKKTILIFNFLLLTYEYSSKKPLSEHKTYQVPF